MFLIDVKCSCDLMVIQDIQEVAQYLELKLKVKTFRIDKALITNKGAIIVYVTLGRRLLGTFLTVYFPTILLNVIGYATNFFKQFFFEVTRYIRLTIK